MTIWIVVVDPVVVHPAGFAWVGVLVDFGAALAGARVAAGLDAAVEAVEGVDAAATTFVPVARCLSAAAGVVAGVDGTANTDSPGEGVFWTSTLAAPLLQAVAASNRLSPAAIVPVVRMSVITDHDGGRFNRTCGC